MVGDQLATNHVDVSGDQVEGNDLDVGFFRPVRSDILLHGVEPFGRGVDEGRAMRPSDILAQAAQVF